jgi:hypothetical protein
MLSHFSHDYIHLEILELSCCNILANVYTRSVQIHPLNSEAFTLKATMRCDLRRAEPLFAYWVRELKYSFFSGFKDPPHSEL